MSTVFAPTSPVSSLHPFRGNKQACGNFIIFTWESLCLLDGAVETAWRDEILMEKKSCLHCIFNTGQAKVGIVIRMLSVALCTTTCGAFNFKKNFFAALGRLLPDVLQVFAIAFYESVPLKHCLWPKNPTGEMSEHSIIGQTATIWCLFSCFSMQLYKKSVWPLGLHVPNLQSSQHFFPPMIDFWRHLWDKNSLNSDAHERPISFVVDQCE